MTEKKVKTVSKNNIGKTSRNLTSRVNICELEIKKLKHQFNALWEPFIRRQKKSSAIEKLLVEELLNSGSKEKNLSRKIATKISKFINGK